MVDKTSRELPHDPRPSLHRPQQHPTSVRRNRSPVEPGHQVTTTLGVKPEGFLDTLCRHRAVLLFRQQSCSPSALCLKENSPFKFYGEKSGLGSSQGGILYPVRMSGPKAGVSAAGAVVAALL